MNAYSKSNNTPDSKVVTVAFNNGKYSIVMNGVMSSIN